MNIRRDGRRFAWLMTGAAIGTTVVLVLALVLPVAREQVATAAHLVLGVLGAVLLGGLLGLVPGVRELEVTAARSMLGVDAEMVVPARPDPVHRLQDVLWVQIHLLLGLVAAACLTMLLPAAVVSLLGASGVGGPLEVLPVPSAATGRIALGAASALGIVAALMSARLLGALAARLAPRLLGPTAGDRLTVALDRAEREAEHTRIARELHDGIGHSLTIVSIQAAAGERVLARDPEAAREALSRIESTAREALVELDGVLATLRDGHEPVDGPADGTVTSSPLPRLAAVLEDHRRAGMLLRSEIEVPPALPDRVRDHLVRIVTELLTNAHRHGGPGPVELRIGPGRDAAGERTVRVEVVNPLPPEGAAPAEARPGGRGLLGLRERLALCDGALEARPHEGSWRARAVIPLLDERTQP